MPGQVLNHKAAHAGACVKSGEDEKRLEHDREVIPDGEEMVSSNRTAENLRHPDGERWRAARAIQQRALADALRERRDRPRIKRESPRADRLRCGVRRFAHNCRGTIDGEINSGLERARGDHGHHADERFHQHRAVTNHAGI